MRRRTFLEMAGLGLANRLVPQAFAEGLDKRTAVRDANPGKLNPADLYGSGHFGRWEYDEHGLPAYRYTCDQLTDPLAVEPVDKAWQSPTNHMHQVGNRRLVGVVSNYGYIQVRQDEGSPKFLNDFCPEQDRYGAGIGFLADDHFVLNTYYTGAADWFDRIFGIGYLRKRVMAGRYEADQIIFAPHGDDPVLVSQVTITNHSSATVRPRWVEYWGCSNYQFSYRALMESGVLGGVPDAVQRRHDLAARFCHRFQSISNGKGLLEKQTFLGRTPQEEEAWRQTQAHLRAKPAGFFFGGPTPPLAPGTSMEDLSPPPTFLVSLDAPADGYATDAMQFFRGGIQHSLGARAPLNNDLSAHGPESAFLLERQLALNPGESRTIYFLYGYLPESFSAEALVAKYSENPELLWSRSCAQWKQEPPLFSTPDHPWVARETQWSSYYIHSGLTRDSFFREHILSQGAGYQYMAGLQGAARDPLQHCLPFVYTQPANVRAILRYTLKEIQPDGSIPYGIVGSGVPMPCVYRPSDLQLWLLWVASEYLLATRDQDFLKERIPLYPRQEAQAGDPTVLDLLHRSFLHLVETIGPGQHGLLRLLNGDWNDSIVYTHVTPEQSQQVFREGESVLNAAMAAYVFDYYARMLDYIDRPGWAHQARAKAKHQREAVQRQWYERWYRRAWLGQELGWVGEKQMWLAPQPWAFIGDCVPPEKEQILLTSIHELACRDSPIGALLQSQPDPTMKDKPGTGTNGGVFAAINGTLVWALSRLNGEMAWNEWMKNTLARHAETYPDMWFGIWSGPDAYNSILAKNPGATAPDFPVLNMHAHAWPLYSTVKLLGTEFNALGVRFKPTLPLDSYAFQSPLLGFTKSRNGYAGWYAPTAAGHWVIEITLPQPESARLSKLTVNGAPLAQRFSEGCMRFAGSSAPGTPLRWEIS